MEVELRKLEKLILEDAIAITYQSVKSYRDMLINFINSERQGGTTSVEKNECEKVICDHHWLPIGDWDGTEIEQCTKCDLMRDSKTRTHGL